VGEATTWFARARRVIPGGVNSPVRAFGAVGGEPFLTASASGATLTTTDGRVLLDYVQSWGASILGHAHPRVVAAVQAAAADGTSYGTPTEREVLLAEAICARVPSVEMVRLVSSGTEAGMSALRLARGVTGRSKLVKFAGHYHGHSDALLASAGSGLLTFGLPASAGVTAGAVADTIVLPWNDVAAVDAAFAEAGADIAVVVAEPVAANMGVVPPAPGFLEHLRAVCDRSGALLLFDEVITGFRLGLDGAQGFYGVTPDLSCFGKVIGGGLPLAAFGGRAELMAELAPAGPVYQAGTLSGNPLATAAGLAVLDELDTGSYAELTDRAARLTDGLGAACAAAGLAAQVPRVGTICGLFLAAAPIVDHAGATAVDATGYARFFHAMLDAGVYLAPSAFEALFVSVAHTDTDVERTVEAAHAAAEAVARGA